MKIKLKDLKVKSFVTGSIEKVNTVKGGSTGFCHSNACSYNCPSVNYCPTNNCASTNCGSGSGNGGDPLPI